MFSGSIPALPTPFADDRIDEHALRSHIEWQINEGATALVICGTTGEAALLSTAERKVALATCISAAAERVPVIAGCGGIGTACVIEQIHQAEMAGAAAALVQAPYYISPGQEGVYGHFEKLAVESGLPIILYNVPGRTVTDIAIDTVADLVRNFPNKIIGIKDASGILGRVSAHRERCGPGFIQLSGNDATTLGFMAMGGAGCISVTANVAPRLCAEFQAACIRGDYATALSIQDRLSALHHALFSDASPGPLKYALSLLRPGFKSDVRLPLTQPSVTSRAQVREALDTLDMRVSDMV